MGTFRKQYSVRTKNSDGSWNHQFHATFANEDQLEEYRDSLSDKVATYGVVEDGKIFVYDAEDEQVVGDTESDGTEVTETNEDQSNESEEGGGQIDYDWEEESDEDDFPFGWWRRNEFVAKDGTVYQKNEEKPELYRTKLPSEY